MKQDARLGLVLIGRNEGERLIRCLASLPRDAGPMVYVDSGSSDGSVRAARKAGIEVIELAPDRPFSAARARNAGWQHLIGLDPDLEFVQFVDGDCELREGWLEAGEALLIRDPSVAAVCGHCTELHPERTIYNLLCDMEWDRELGEIGATGGNVMLRVGALRAVGGFDESMIAGEEPDLCRRLRAAEWRLCRIDMPMVHHDAAMERFGQWWTRARRSGFVDATNALRNSQWRAVFSALAWGFAVPAAIALGAIAFGAIALIPGVLAYTVLAARIYRHYRRAGRSRRHAALGAAFLILAKVPQLQGALVYAYRRLMRRENRLIEYKLPTDTLKTRSDYGVGTPPFGGP